jgi:hypothetical protein
LGQEAIEKPHHGEKEKSRETEEDTGLEEGRDLALVAQDREKGVFTPWASLTKTKCQPSDDQYLAPKGRKGRSQRPRRGFKAMPLRASKTVSPGQARGRGWQTSLPPLPLWLLLARGPSGLRGPLSHHGALYLPALSSFNRSF